MVGWLRRLRDRYPDADTTIHIDVSANALLQMVAANQLDVAFVHEVEGAPLRVPEGVERRVLVEREPQSRGAGRNPIRPPRGPRVRLADLAADQSGWSTPAWDGEGPGAAPGCCGCRGAQSEGGVRGLSDRRRWVASGEVVTPCQPTASACQGVAWSRSLHGDPLTVRRPGPHRWLRRPAPGPPDEPRTWRSRPNTEATGPDDPGTVPGAPLDVDALFGDLADAYLRDRLGRLRLPPVAGSGYSRLLRSHEPRARDALMSPGLAGPAEVCSTPPRGRAEASDEFRSAGRSRHGLHRTAGHATRGASRYDTQDHPQTALDTRFSSPDATTTTWLEGA
ncbi:Small neutral protease regulatory protein OS=Streptomyces antimycoticus OX=68175 GN=mprR PE=3 SV=1 [Streptomyces antimycoticus]